VEDTPSGIIRSLTLNCDKEGHVQQVVKQAHEQLVQLLQERAELMKRIGTLKQTIAGLANLFGNGVLSKDLQELVGGQKDKNRHPGFTDTCRRILMEAARPMSAREICDKMREKMPPMLARHREPVASVTTVMNRLASYGEAKTVTINERRAWQWIAEQVPGGGS
jgi:chorismate mutase